MRIFYVPWVMICGVWGWLAADPVFAKPEVSVIEWLLALVLVPAVSLAIVMYAPNSNSLPRPSLSLKPWNLPMGLSLFVSISFVAIGAWALVFSFVRDGTLRLANPLPLVVGLVWLGGTLLAPRLFPVCCPTPRCSGPLHGGLAPAVSRPLIANARRLGRLA
jgi:hypothetical protein